MKIKYRMILRYVYPDHKEKLLVQVYSINQFKQKEMLIYGLYNDIFEVEKGVLGKRIPEPWQGELVYKPEKLGKKVYLKIMINNDKVKEIRGLNNEN
jgi:hypothetical protein